MTREFQQRFEAVPTVNPLRAPKPFVQGAEAEREKRFRVYQLQAQIIGLQKIDALLRNRLGVLAEIDPAVTEKFQSSYQQDPQGTVDFLERKRKNLIVELKTILAVDLLQISPETREMLNHAASEGTTDIEMRLQEITTAVSALQQDETKSSSLTNTKLQI